MRKLFLFTGILCVLFISIVMPIDAKKKVVRHDAIITFYYADDSEMEGGYYDALGVPLDGSQYHCAAPKEFALLSYIKIGGTGNWRDGHVYQVRDRGGRIVTDENGVVHIDILVTCKEVADRLGVMHGWVEAVED